MKAERASGLITQAQYIGMSMALATRIQRDIQELRVAVSPVTDALDPSLLTLTVTINKVVDGLNQANIANVKAGMLRPGGKQEGRR